MSPPVLQPMPGSNIPYTLVRTKASPIISKPNSYAFTGDLYQLKQGNMSPKMQNHNKRIYPRQEEECSSATDSGATTASAEYRSYIWNHGTGAFLEDASGNPVAVETFLNTKPLRNDLQTRPGPGGRKLTYISGDVVTRTLNQAFGYDGWSFSVLGTTQQQAVDLNKDEKDKPPKWLVSYTAHVRISLVDRKTGLTPCFREDYGFGDTIDKCLSSAIGNAIKASITDGMKRAARLMGEKLGNSLYASSFALNKAPQSLGQALKDYQTSEQECQRQILAKKNVQQQQQHNSAQDVEEKQIVPSSKPVSLKPEPKKELVAEHKNNPYPNKATAPKPQNVGVQLKDNTGQQVTASNASISERSVTEMGNRNSAGVTLSVTSGHAKSGCGQLHMVPPNSYTTTNHASDSEFPQSGMPRSRNTTFHTGEAGSVRQQNQQPLARVSDVTPTAAWKNHAAGQTAALCRDSFDGSEMHSHENIGYDGPKQPHLPRVSDVSSNPPQNSAGVTFSVTSGYAKSGCGQLHMGPPNSYTTTNHASDSEFPQSGMPRSRNTTFHSSEVGSVRQQNQQPLTRVSDVTPTAAWKNHAAGQTAALYRDSFDGSETHSHENVGYEGPKHAHLPRVSDVSSNPPQTSAQTMQAMFGRSNEFDEDGEEQWNKRPATATGQRSTIQATAAKKKKTGHTANPYQQQPHAAHL